ncbi:MAG TPA: NTP transferase domain-containing protein [Candidatus Nanopelagicales bacterium]|nr:NTP transferase domain-containing protein [Candidatus Nanopelagicales bacterium]
MSTAGLVLAAGEGRRFGGPKAPFVLGGERLVDRAVRLLHEAGCSPVVVVLGAWVGEVPDARVVVNDRWVEGMGSSLRVGLAALEEEPDVDRALVTLVDLVGLTSPAVHRVLASSADLAAAAYGGERRHPVLLARSRWADAAAVAHGDRGARDLLSAADVDLVEVGDLATPDDLDIRP